MRKLVEVRYPKAEKLLKELLTKGGADAGYFEGNIHPESESQSMAEIAAYNEFGTATIPARPFMSLAAQDSEGDIIKLVEYEMSKVNYKSVLCYKKLGLLLASNIKKRIRNSPSWAVKNALSTIKQKRGSSHPLFDTGYMLKTVDYKYTVD